MDQFFTQYEWVRLTRESLFDYCEGISSSDYIKEIESFAGDSIRDLHAHVAGCYQYWLGTHALGKSITRMDPTTINTVQEMRELFRKTDDLVAEFLQEYQGKWEHSIPVTFKDGSTTEFTTLWLFTHTTTHEFHHKGQIVKIGRQLGYTPPDTDLIDPRLVQVHH